MICFDREFPEAARILMLKGAELVLVPNACEIEQNRKAQLISRAFENMMGIALANYCAPLGNGHSMALSGIAFAYDAAQGRCKSCNQMIAEGGETPGLIIAEFDIGALRAYREAEVWGNAFRRPQLYGKIIDHEITEPFTRNDRRFE